MDKSVEFHFYRNVFELHWSSSAIDNLTLVESYDFLLRKIMTQCKGNQLQCLQITGQKITIVDAVVQGLERLEIKVPDSSKTVQSNKKETRTSYQITDQGAVVEQHVSIPIPESPVPPQEEIKEAHPKPEAPAPLSPTPLPPKLTLDEVAKHKTQNDCWMVIEDCVYNLTDYLKQHPGGAQKLMMGAGKDATQLFRKYHAYIQHKQVARQYYIGGLSR